jgi:hypothetical protein
MTRIALAAVLAALPSVWSAADDAGALTPKKLKRHYSRTVQEHIKAESAKNGGAFIVRDDVLNRDWRLKLIRIHTHKIVELGEGRFFACADLKEVGGDKTKLDLDFFVARQGDRWVMEKVVVHKVSGKPRYVYNDDNEMVPVP